MPRNEYTFVSNLVNEFEIPDKGITSRVLHKDERLNITLFGFSAGQELSTYSASTPALIHVLEGEADVDLGKGYSPSQAGFFHPDGPASSPRNKSEGAVSNAFGPAKRSSFPEVTR